MKCVRFFPTAVILTFRCNGFMMNLCRPQPHMFPH
jgi:hypothetical protein